VGTERCAGCHPAEAERWRGSHHDRAMEEATPASVLGDFGDARLEHFGVVSRFRRLGDRFVVTTEGPEGVPADFEVAYTFGVDPLQQYLVRFPRGRLQALSTAWDARPREAGGQRWFDLHAAERVPPGDVLHWTGPAGSWNAQCAECHSTALRKGYDLATDTYAPSWSELDVGCEACHGPGASHAAWAEAAAAGETPGPASAPGLAPLAVDDARWVLAPGAAIARREPPRREHLELETCARCHARRTVLDEAWVPGTPLLDTHRPALLVEGLYHADGQMLDEVYVYGSFLQSRMHAAGVTCSDCHDPHALAPRAAGDALCAQCHQPEVFAVPAHHHHREASDGARCVACHMPERTYMGVDARREHAFRVPRPDLSVAIGVPNACTDCHAERPASWAAAAVERWFPEGRRTRPHFATALEAGRRGAAGADAALAALASDAEEPGIVRATALTLVRDPWAERAALARALADSDALVRLGALEALERLEPAERVGLGDALLDDPLRAVRIEAARVLAAAPPPRFAPGRRVALADALAEYRAAQTVNADRPEAHLDLALLHEALGEPEAARAAYERAIRIAPWFVPSYVNLADRARAEGRDDESERLLRRALEVAPDAAQAWHALGLSLVRQGRRGEALAALARAAELDPAEPRFDYVLGVALHDAGRREEAIRRLAAAHERHPHDRDLVLALALFEREAGRAREARAWVEQLLARRPDDREALALRAELDAAEARP
jgi:tetratricopeptide (TPR) repeat protein